LLFALIGYKNVTTFPVRQAGWGVNYDEESGYFPGENQASFLTARDLSAVLKS
jgi:hypothetical protein